MKCKWMMLFAMSATCLGADDAYDRDRVFAVSGCTAFFVAPDLFMTAKHCELARTITVKPPGVKTPVKATRVYQTSSSDGPVVYQIPGGRFAYYDVAERLPAVSAAVYCVGYPGDNWVRTEGTLTGCNPLKTINFTDQRINTGNSGGPLLNRERQVIGVALIVSADLKQHVSGFSGWRVTREAYLRAVSATLPKDRPLIVFTSPKCKPCEQFKAEIKDQAVAANIKYVMEGSEEWGTYTRKFEAATGQRVTAAPTFWVDGSTEFRQTFTPGTALSVIGWAIKIIKFLVTMIAGDKPDGSISGDAVAEYSLDLQPIPESDLPPTPSEAIVEDFEGVRIVLAVAELPTLVPSLRKIWVAQAEQRLRDKSADLFKGQAVLDLVTQRNRPAAYGRLGEVFGELPDPATCYVFVPARRLGLKGLIVKRVEKKLEAQLLPSLRRARIVLVIERIHGQQFADGLAALSVPEPERYERTESTGLAESVKAALIKVAVEKAISTLEEKHPQLAELAAIVKPALVDEPGSDADADSESVWLQRGTFGGVMAAVLGLLVTWWRGRNKPAAVVAG